MYWCCSRFIFYWSSHKKRADTTETANTASVIWAGKVLFAALPGALVGPELEPGMPDMLWLFGDIPVIGGGALRTGGGEYIVGGVD